MPSRGVPCWRVALRRDRLSVVGRAGPARRCCSAPVSRPCRSPQTKLTGHCSHPILPTRTEPRHEWCSVDSLATDGYKHLFEGLSMAVLHLWSHRLGSRLGFGEDVYKGRQVDHHKKYAQQSHSSCTNTARLLVRMGHRYVYFRNFNLCFFHSDVRPLSCARVSRPGPAFDRRPLEAYRTSKPNTHSPNDTARPAVAPYRSNEGAAVLPQRGQHGFANLFQSLRVADLLAIGAREEEHSGGFVDCLKPCGRDLDRVLQM